MMQKPHFQSLLETVAEEESLESCDRLARGEVKIEELEAQLSGASARMQALRKMSEPLSADLRKQLGDILERPTEAAAVVPAAPIALRPRVKRSTYAAPIGIALALAAAMAVVAVPRLFRSEALPEFTLEAAARDGQVLGGPATTTAGAVHAKKGSCLELTLRPKRRYQGVLFAQLFLIPQSGGAPVLWSTMPYQSEAGTLRPDGPCLPLPANAEAGDWRLVAVYGSRLPEAATLREILAHAPQSTPAHGNGWATITQTLQISN